ncbi:unnamed protein product [Caenorhabditis angaria]|uniref:Uncharacterized protein n=1 Tax=Caenorhabditis angaria TaxID=860376 RepID=A0A9P1IEW1_9PELO|nr:unnamed protein product [Caenorhabditis angaria]
MSKLLIFLIIPAVLSTTTIESDYPEYTTQSSQQQQDVENGPRGLRFSDFSTTIQPSQDASILGYQFLTAFLNAVRADDYSIFAQNFTAPIFDKNGTVIAEASKEALFRGFQEAHQEGSVEEVFPRNELEFGLVNASDGNQYLKIAKAEDEVLIIFTVQVSSEKQFSLLSLELIGVTVDSSAGLIQKLI